MRPRRNTVQHMVPAVTVTDRSGPPVPERLVPAEGSGLERLRSLLRNATPELHAESARQAKLLTAKARAEATAIIRQLDARASMPRSPEPGGNGKLCQPAGGEDVN